MSIKDQAVRECKAAGMPDDEIETIRKILSMFFDKWDSGGAVGVMVPALNRLLLGLPLTPLTGEEGEWTDVSAMEGRPPGTLFQNVRCSRVFKRKSETVVRVYDVDRHDEAIVFPYYPED